MEEEDHLIRSTKKVKNDHDFSSEMVQDPLGSVASPPIQDTVMSGEDVNSQDLQSPGTVPLEEPIPKVLSFKQALISNREKEIPFSADVENPILGEDIPEENETEIEDEEQDGIPVIHLPKSLLVHAREPWKNDLIVKPIGYPIGYKSLCAKARPLWDLQGDFSALDIGMGFVVFKFDMSSDHSNVLTNGPWIINDQYITVRAWEPRFKPDEAEEIKTAVWIRFPNFPLEYYYEKDMFRIAKRLGRPIKADSTTVETERGRYAKVCVEVDLSKPLKSRVLIEGKIYRVEYEHIPVMCFGCGRVGHRRDQCSWAPKITPPSTSDIPSQPVTTSDQKSGDKTIAPTVQMSEYGQWILVQKRTRRPNGGRRFADRNQVAQTPKGKIPGVIDIHF